MKERITIRRGKIVQTLSTPFFFGKSKLLQPALINIIENDSPCPQHRPVRFLPELKCGHLDIVHPSLVPRVRPFGSVHENSKMSFVWPFK